jgi:hypothetical protein
MKSLCSLLIFVLAIHSQCGVECLISALEAASAPPCHEDSPNPHHDDADDGGLCDAAQSFESIAPLFKSFSQCLPAFSPGSASPGDETAITAVWFYPNPTPAHSPSALASVLRI